MKIEKCMMRRAPRVVVPLSKRRISARTRCPKQLSGMAPPTSIAKPSPAKVLNKKMMRLAVGAEFAEKLAEDALELGSEAKLRTFLDALDREPGAVSELQREESIGPAGSAESPEP